MIMAKIRGKFECLPEQKRHMGRFPEVVGSGMRVSR
jgi:hypothetical protein